jgi:DNA-binding transcriptional ArsR family regulator
MLESIVTSKTRIQLLLRFFLDGERAAYLRELSTELGESTNAVRVELNRLAEAKIIESFTSGRSKLYRANKNHPLFPDLQSIVKKTLGIDKLIEQIIHRLGDVKLAFVTGDYARGIDGGIIDLVLVGEVNFDFLDRLVKHTEPLISNRKIRYLCLSEDEFASLSEKFSKAGLLEIYTSDNKKECER